MPIYVNDEKIPEEMIEREMEQMRPQYQRQFPDKAPEAAEEELREWARENAVERTLITQAALEDQEPLPAETVEERFQQLLQSHGGAEQFYRHFGIDASKEEEVKADLEKQLRVERLARQVTATATEPSEEEVRKYYEENQEQFKTPPQVRASHIVKHVDEKQDAETARAEIEKARKKLRNGEVFSLVAEQFSDCPDKGGSLGVFPPGQMVQEFDEVVFNLKEGAVSEIFQTPFGFHIATVEERVEAEPVPFEQIKDRLSQHLFEEQRRKLMEDFVDRQREKADIRVEDAEEAADQP